VANATLSGRGASNASPPDRWNAQFATRLRPSLSFDDLIRPC